MELRDQEKSAESVLQGLDTPLQNVVYLNAIVQSALLKVINFYTQTFKYYLNTTVLK